MATPKAAMVRKTSPSALVAGAKVGSLTLAAALESGHFDTGGLLEVGRDDRRDDRRDDTRDDRDRDRRHDGYGRDRDRSRSRERDHRSDDRSTKDRR
jgi:hypothetical protein